MIVPDEEPESVFVSRIYINYAQVYVDLHKHTHIYIRMYIYETERETERHETERERGWGIQCPTDY